MSADEKLDVNKQLGVGLANLFAVAENCGKAFGRRGSEICKFHKLGSFRMIL